MRISYRDEFVNAIRDFDDCRIKITVEKLYNKRSVVTYNEDGTRKGGGQNGYYHFILLEELAKALTAAFGRFVTKTEAHEFCRNRFWGEEHVLSTGEIITIPGHSSEKSTVDFEERLQRIRDFAHDYLDWKIPLPNEQSEMPFTEFKDEENEKKGSNRV